MHSVFRQFGDIEEAIDGFCGDSMGRGREQGHSRCTPHQRFDLLECAELQIRIGAAQMRERDAHGRARLTVGQHRRQLQVRVRRDEAQ